MLNKLKNMDAEKMSFYTINMNSFSDAPALQIILEQPLEKKSGVRYGPPGARRLVYFVDDMNMPFVDKYDTQSAIELLRQMIDYNGWWVLLTPWEKGVGPAWPRSNFAVKRRIW